MKQLLLIFTKTPVLGKVKTRLAKDIGPHRALAIHQILVEKTLSAIAPLQVDKALFYTAAIPKKVLAQDNIQYFMQQKGANLGARMEAAFKWGFKKGYQQIIIIGSDLWDLDSSLLEEAFEALSIHKTIIGPATDGGYYLLGLQHPKPELFQNKQWGWESVLEATLAELYPEKPYLLPPKTDVDYLDDLLHFPDLERLFHQLPKNP